MDKSLIETVADDLRSRGYNPVVKEGIFKSNRVATGIYLQEEEGIPAATFYDFQLEEMSSRHGFSTEELADYILNSSMAASLQISDLQEMLEDRDYILGNVQLSICNAGWNREMLSETPHELVAGTDLAVYARIPVSDNGSIRVTDDFVLTTGIEKEELLSCAKTNSRKQGYTVRSMLETIAAMTGLPEEMLPPQEMPMYILSNPTGIYGAAAITDPETLETARAKIGADKIFLLPSSIYEVIAIPADKITALEAASMIQEINTSEVSLSDRLGERPYVWDGKRMEIAKTEMVQKARGQAR